MLGCLIEKQRTTPEQYPLTLNALRLACNQTTNREPVLELDESRGARGGAEPRHEGLCATRHGAGLAHGEVPAALPGGARPDAGRGLDPRRADAARAADRLRAEDAHSRGSHSIDDVPAGARAASTRRSSCTSCRGSPGQREERWTHLLAETAAEHAEEADGDPGEARSPTLARPARRAARGARSDELDAAARRARRPRLAR